MIPRREDWQIAPEPGWPLYEYPVPDPNAEFEWVESFWRGNDELQSTFAYDLAIKLFRELEISPDAIGC